MTHYHKRLATINGSLLITWELHIITHRMILNGDFFLSLQDFFYVFLK
ncbi:hypothetical protein OMAG_002872 [Candidatus Omnitrophus magneticus]|uniref:Uncharacterized protein n=1 Tax=Candidatus Omnitrophus magneticus TaxID=1609969 RepID=A0A0F0CMP6_9BACT|nr:hypothetical protein OMAG_002872 [Candidatus Omnitrophus magneticus]